MTISAEKWRKTTLCYSYYDARVRNVLYNQNICIVILVS